MKLKKVINIFGGPGSGKSTLAAMLFAKMKMQGYSVELVSEYAKQMVFEERMNVLTEDQLYVFAKQHRKILTLKNTVDYIITDSPFIHGIEYLNDEIYNREEFESLLLSTFNSYPNLNIFLVKSSTFEYEQMGRYQNEEQAEALGNDIYQSMNRLGLTLVMLNAGNDDNYKNIMSML